MPPRQGTKRLWEGMTPDTVTMKCRKAFRVAAKSLFGSLARTVCGQMVHPLGQYEGLNLAGTQQTVLAGFWLYKETLFRDHKGGRAEAPPSPASTYLHRLCQDISPWAEKSLSQFLPAHLLGAAAIATIPPCSKMWTWPRSWSHHDPCPMTALGTRASEGDARARKELKGYLAQMPHFTNRETEAHWGEVTHSHLLLKEGYQAIEPFRRFFSCIFCDMLVSVISVCKILVWRLENTVTSELPRVDLGGKLNSFTSKKDPPTSFLRESRE